MTLHMFSLCYGKPLKSLIRCGRTAKVMMPLLWFRKSTSLEISVGPSSPKTTGKTSTSNFKMLSVRSSILPSRIVVTHLIATSSLSTRIAALL